MASVTGILDKIKNINATNVVDAKVPSVGVKKFNPLTIKQQKDLVKSALDGSSSTLTLTNAINSILVENSVESLDFKVTDKYPVIIELRKQAFGSKYVQDEVEIDLDEILSRDLVVNTNKTSFLLGESVIEVEVEVPFISKENEITKFVLESFSKVKEEKISTVVGNLFVYEIIKFISSLKINGEDADFNKMTVSERYQIIENLPVTLNNDILDYINAVREQEMKYLTVGETVLSVDARLFNK